MAAPAPHQDVAAAVHAGHFILMLLLNIMYPGLPLNTGAVVRQGGAHKHKHCTGTVAYLSTFA